MVLAINNCCFCIKLRTGSLIIGYLNLIWDLTITLLSIYFVLMILTFGRDLIIAYVMTIFFIIHLIFNIVLLVSLHKRKRGFINDYLIYTIIFNIMLVTIYVSRARTPSTGLIIVNLVYLVISIYFLVVIRSYSLKMNADASERPVIFITA